MNPVHERDGQWYFYDETQAYEHGPFATEAMAKDALNYYLAHL